MTIRDRLGDKADARGDGSARTKRGPARTFPRGRVIQMLAESVSQTAIAKMYGVSQPAISVFARRPDVVKEIETLRTDALDIGRARLGGGTNRALDVIADVINDIDEKSVVRLKAAEIWLKLALAIQQDNGSERTQGPLTSEDLELARRFLAERDAERAPADGQ